MATSIEDENAGDIFIIAPDEPATVQKYAMKTSDGSS
jgi:hypothetical protein